MVEISQEIPICMYKEYTILKI